MVKPNDKFKRVCDKNGELFKVQFEAPSPDTLDAYDAIEDPSKPKDSEEAVIVHKVNMYRGEKDSHETYLLLPDGPIHQDSTPLWLMQDRKSVV